MADKGKINIKYFSGICQGNAGGESAQYAIKNVKRRKMARKQ